MRYTSGIAAGLSDVRLATQFATSAAIAAMGLVMDNTTIYQLSRKIKWDFYILKAIATVIVAMWNFVMNLLITFA